MIEDHNPEKRTPGDALSAPGASVGLAAIPGLVMARSLLALPGHEAVCEAVLSRFAEHHARRLPQLAAWADADRWGEIGRALHQLLGSCAAVGAVDLAGRCGLLEGQVRALAAGSAGAEDAASLPSGLATLQVELLTLVATIADRLAKPGRAHAAPAEAQ